MTGEKKKHNEKSSGFAIKNIFCSLLKREDNYLDHQRQLIYAIYVVMVSMAILSNILGISGAFDPFFTATNCVFLTMILVVAGIYLAHKISITKTIAFSAIILHTFISIDIWYSAFVPMLKDNTMVILINMLILTVNMIFSLATYQIRLTQMLNTISVVTYVVCVVVTGDESLRNYFIMMLIILAFIYFISFRIAKNGEHLVNVNKALRKEEAELLQVLRINKKQIRAYVALAREQRDVNETTNLFHLLGDVSQRNVVDNVMRYVKDQELRKHRIENIFPELSPSELEICQLILKDKKLSEICILLDKTESNITTQRANIRKKLGMLPSQNLQEILEERIKASDEKKK